MEIEFKNLGKIKEAKFDLSKNLTVFVGKNNTGKTYAAYGIYGFYNQDEIKYGKSRNFLNNLKLSNNDFEIKEKDNQVLIKLINIQEFKKFCNYYVEYLLSEVQNNLGKVFHKEIKENLKVKLTDDFEKTFNNFQKTRVTNKIRINLNGNEDFISTIFDLINELIINNLPIIVSKERTKFEFKISLEKINEIYKDAIISYIKYHINNILISSFSVFYLSFINRIIYFFPIERTSLNVIHKTIIKDYLENNIGSKELNIDSQYLLPEPVISYLTFLNTISSLKNKESKFEKTIQEIEKNIIYGDIKFNHVKEGIEFYTKNKKIPFNFSASSVKSISSFVLYLEYLATKKRYNHHRRTRTQFTS